MISEITQEFLNKRADKFEIIWHSFLIKQLETVMENEELSTEKIKERFKSELRSEYINDEIWIDILLYNWINGEYQHAKRKKDFLDSILSKFEE